MKMCESFSLPMDGTWVALLVDETDCSMFAGEKGKFSM